MNTKNFLKLQNDSFKVPEKEMLDIGITYFSYGIISQGDVLISHFTNTEWGDLYKEKHYNKVDPLLHCVLHSRFPLIVWDALHLFGEEKKIMMERNEICHLKSGLTVGINNKEFTEIIAFGSEVPSQEFYSLLKEEIYTRKIYEIISQFYNSHKESSSQSESHLH